MKNTTKPGSGALTEQEISLGISLLKSEKYENQQILGFLNIARARKKISPLNPARVSELKSYIKGTPKKTSENTLKRFRNCNPASQKEVESFLEEISSLDIDAGTSPLSDTTIKNLLNIKSFKETRLDITETDIIECKEKFDAPMKTIAAFANNKGGYFLFGVKDKTWEILGLKDDTFKNYDLKKISSNIRSKLGCDLQIDRKILEINGKKIGILYIAPARIKPVIFATGDDGGVSQGQIYYRYAGEDRLISHQDLQHLIEERIKQLSETLLSKHISNILRAGIENAAIMNIETGEVEGKSGNFVIDESLLPKLRFLREGEFVEKSGAPALKLIGDLSTHSIIAQPTPINISETDLMEVFLKQEKVLNPEAYIKRFSEASKDWLPIYYYANLAKISVSDIIKILKINTSVKQSKLIISKIAENLHTFIKRRTCPQKSATYNYINYLISQIIKLIKNILMLFYVGIFNSRIKILSFNF